MIDIPVVVTVEYEAEIDWKEAQGNFLESQQCSVSRSRGIHLQKCHQSSVISHVEIMWPLIRSDEKVTSPKFLIPV